MTPNVNLSQYSNEDVNSLIVSGSISSKFDDSGNLLIDYLSSKMVDTSISIKNSFVSFDSTKVEEKYDVVFRDFTV